MSCGRSEDNDFDFDLAVGGRANHEDDSRGKDTIDIEATTLEFFDECARSVRDAATRRADLHATSREALLPHCEIDRICTAHTLAYWQPKQT